MVTLCGCATQPDDFDLSYPEYGMQQIIEAAVNDQEKYVVDDSTRYCTPRNRTSISRSAWEVLSSYALELPEATVQITTTTRTDDIVESVIQIRGLSQDLRCQSGSGSVLFVCLYVYTCTVSMPPP